MNVLRCRSCGSLNNYPGARPGKIARCGSCRGTLDESGKPQGVREEELARTVEGSPVPVIALVWDPTDPRCREAARQLESLSTRRAGGLIALTVDVEVHPDFPGRRAIETVPSFLLFRGNVETGRQTGAPGEEALERWALKHGDPAAVH